jgi:DNA-binding LacI/PurR family transcriptional regulator
MRLSPRPTALLLPDDEVAIGMLWALEQQGLRVPEQVAVIGFDDHPAAAYARPPLTTLAQPAAEAGARLAQLLLDGLKDPQQIAGCAIKLPARLVIRESCGATRRDSKEDES